MGAFVFTMLLFFGFIALALLFAVISSWKRRSSRRKLLAVFLEYNDHSDLQIVIKWIQAVQHDRRLLEALEYLETIKELKLAKELFHAVGESQDRSVQMTILRIYRALGDERSVAMARSLQQNFTHDDAVIDAFCGTLLDQGLADEVKPILEQRLAKKIRGTTFSGHWAHMLAEQGQIDEAMSIWTKVELQERTLFENSLAQPNKSLIEAQWKRTRTLMERYGKAHTTKG